MHLFSIHTIRRAEVLIFALIIVLAAFFRFHQLELYPPGLYPDEAMNGNNALNALDTGEYRIFYPDNNGREGLFINLQALSISKFGNTAWALRSVSALIGTLTVAGLYLLARRLFNRRIAALSSFLMAISFWHVLFSRIGFRAIMAPFFLVWALYFFWRGMALGKIWNFSIGGALLGLGMHTYLAFRAIPLVFIAVMFGYLQTIKHHFSHAKYRNTRKIIGTGIQLFILVAIATAFPLLHYFYNNPADFMGRTAQVSVFSSPHIASSIAVNALKTLGMFVYEGDHNWRHNFSGEPLLFWPIAAFFAVGLLRSILELFRVKKSHGHFSTVHTLLLSWFAVALLPSVISNEGIPHALRAIIAAPVVFIFAALGIEWAFRFLESWYAIRDLHEAEVTLPQRHQYHIPEGTVTVAFILVIFLSAIGLYEYDKYFNRWARHPQTAAAFEQKYVLLAKKLNELPRQRVKYVLVNAPGVLVVQPGGAAAIPMPAQTVMYLTDTWTPEKQREKNIYYLTPEQYDQKQYRLDGTVYPLELE